MFRVLPVDGLLVDLLRAPALVGWAVHVVDAADAAARLGRAGFTASKLQPGSRVTPQGATLEWSTFDVEKPRVGSAPYRSPPDSQVCAPA